MKRIIGVDEVGRGPWAGPVVACAVALNQDIEGLEDSKRLTPKKRQELSKEIINHSKMHALGWVSPSQVDRLGLSAATALAMRKAVKQLNHSGYDIIIDGNINFLGGFPRTKAVIKADQSVPEVSAASIVAKVARDEYMKKQSDKYPGYGFETNFGYGTRQHLDGLEKLGLCPLHRKSFKPIIEQLKKGG